jgi:hypothetical protein
MLKRPGYEGKELKDLKDEADSAAAEVMERCVKMSKNDVELSHGVTFNEFVAINVLKCVAVNIVLQDKGTLKEYLDFINAEITEGYNAMVNDKDVKPFLAGGKEISNAEMIKSHGHEVH